MNAASRKAAYLPRTTRNISPEQSIPAERAAAAARHAESASRAAFFEDMEVAMTCTVLIGALLFGAALIRYGAPAGQLRDGAAATLYALATLGGIFLCLFTLKGIYHRIAFLARPRG